MQNAQFEPATAFSVHALTEEELISSAANGNEEAFEAIMRRYNRMLFRTAQAFVALLGLPP